MPAKKYRVSLTESEREQLSNIARRGKSSAREVKRALILCQADEGLSDEQIAEALLVGASTVSVAVACSQAPAGHARWTLRLLADKVVELEFADSISPETVRQVLKKTSSNRGRRRSGAFQR
jgi:hypothetical protein